MKYMYYRGISLFISQTRLAH